MEDEEKVGGIVIKLQGLVKEFGLANNERQLTDISKELFEFAGELVKYNTDNRKMLIDIHACSITLWNLSVAMKTGASINSIINAKARHVSCQLTYMANKREPTSMSLRKVVMMAVKTGRAWLDCNDPTMAKNSLGLAFEAWKTLCEKGKSLHDTTSDYQAQETEENVLKLYAYKAETETLLHNQEEGAQCLEKAVELLQKFPRQALFLASLCYNLGLETFEKKDYVSSVNWLRKSCDIAKMHDPKRDVVAKIQGTTLRLLALVYLELGGEGNIKLALEAIDSSITEDGNPKAYYLKTKILLAGDFPDDHVCKVLDQTMKLEKLTLEIGLSIGRLTHQHGRRSLLDEWLLSLQRLFSDPANSLKIQIYKVELALTESKNQMAHEIINEHIIPGIQLASHLDDNLLKRFNVLLWETAAKAHEVEDFTEALQWYTYSQHLYKPSERTSGSWAKLQRNRASCLIGIKDYEAAEITLHESERIEAGSPYSRFLLYKTYLLRGDLNEATSAVDKLTELADSIKEKDTVHGFVCLAAQMAFERGQQALAIKALENVVGRCGDKSQALTVLRCLTRLRFATMGEEEKRKDVDVMIRYIKRAYDVLEEESTKASLKSEYKNDILWFVKISWNLALQSHESTKEMHELFVLCYELSILLQPGESNQSQQKSCLVMACASALESVREQMIEEAKVPLLHKVLFYIGKAKELYQQTSKHDIKGAVDPTPSLLLTYELEAAARLGKDGDLPAVIDRALELPSVEPKTLENMASILIQVSRSYENIAVKALKAAAKLHLNSPSTNYQALSKVLHSLIDITIKRGNDLDISSRQECFQLYEQTMQVIEEAKEDTYPEMEIVWLMTRAWNSGIHFYSSQQYEQSEKWCGMAMKLLDHLRDLKENYNQHMNNVYSEVLLRLQSDGLKSQRTNEE